MHRPINLKYPNNTCNGRWDLIRRLKGLKQDFLLLLSWKYYKTNSCLTFFAQYYSGDEIKEGAFGGTSGEFWRKLKWKREQKKPRIINRLK
jgi:hypothetical protein